MQIRLGLSIFSCFGSSLMAGRDDTYQVVADWTVDPVSGSDSSAIVGTTCTVKTVKELNRRLDMHISRPVTVTILSALPSSDPLDIVAFSTWDYSLSTSPPTLTIIGTPTVTRTGQFTASGTAAVPATNTPPTVTDTSVSDWTSEVGSVLLFTGGTGSGSVCLVAKNQGSGVARTSPVSNGTTGAGTLPSSSTTYSVNTPMVLPANTRVVSDATVIFKWLSFPNDNLIQASYIVMYMCRPGSGRGTQTFDSWGLSRVFYACRPAQSGTGSQTALGLYSWQYSLFDNESITVGQNATVTVVNSLFQAQRLVVGGTSGTAAMHGKAVLSGVGIFDTTSTAALQCNNGGRLHIAGTVYGSGNAVGSSFKNFPDVIITSGAANVPTLAASGTELSLDGAANHMPGLLTNRVDTAGVYSMPASSPLTTWAQFAAAPFSGNVVSEKGGHILTYV